MNFLENANIKDHGLSNQEATCYLNSVLQELFMTKEFTEAVERHNTYLDHHLKDLFDELQRHTAYTDKITNKLGIDRVYEQRDAAEYYEKILTQTSPVASQIFHGQLTHKTICSKCETERSTDSRVWHLPLALMDSYSEEYRVVDGIEEYFRDSHFSGQDQMYCDQCDAKRDVTVKCEVKHHPEVLVLLLKRFEFDYRYMTYVKNNRSVDIPHALQIPENQTYELYAVVDHVGDLRGGHYAAIIKSQDDDRWYNFSDTSVTVCGYQPFQVDNNKSQSAYLLFYRKQTSITQNRLQILPHPADIKYHGLFNQGATCYLNSVLQVLFMTKEFREAVERHTTYLDRHLKDLFDHLQRHTVYTCETINKLGINRVYEQHDAAEYYEKTLTQTSPDASLVHGQLTHQTICCKCQTGRIADSRVWHLPLVLMDSHSEEYQVVNGIEEYFRDSHFSGQDQMYCDQCGVKLDVITKCEVKHHPEVLVLLLKRFEIDYTHLTYVKNNRSVDFPHTLQIPQNQTYELYAVVDHVGDLRGGHYAAIINYQNNGPWYNFNDDRITLLDYQPFQVDNTEKSQTVYLLFYRKQTNTCSQDIREVSTSGGFLPATSDNYDQSQATENIRQREEVEEAVEDGNDTAETVSIDRHEETGTRDKVNVGSRGVEPVDPEPNVCYIEDQDDGVHIRQSVTHNEKYCCEKERDEGKIMIQDDEDMRRNAETDDQTEKTETLPRETQTEERVEDQDAAGVDDVKDKTPHSNYDFNPEVSDRHPIHSPLHKPHEMSKEQRRVMDVRTDKETDDVRQKMNKAQEGKLKIKHQVDPVCVDNRHFKDITEGKSRDNELASESGNLLTRNDLHKYTKDVWDRNHEQQGEMKKVKGGERGDDNYAQRREKSIMKYDSEGVDYQHNRKLDHNRFEHIGVEYNGEEEIIKVQFKKDKKHGDDGGAGVKPQNKSNHNNECQKEISDTSRSFNSRQVVHREEKIDGKRNDEDVQRSRRSGRYCGGGIESHRNQRQQEIRHKDLVNQTKGDEKKGENVHTENREDVYPGQERSAGGRGRIEKERKTLNRSDAERDTVEENEISIIHSNDKNMQNVFEAQTEAAGIKHPSKQRGEKKRKWWHFKSPLKQQRKEKKKKTTGCFGGFQKKHKNKNQVNESD